MLLQLTAAPFILLVISRALQTSSLLQNSGAWYKLVMLALQVELLEKEAVTSTDWPLAGKPVKVTTCGLVAMLALTPTPAAVTSKVPLVGEKA